MRIKQLIVMVVGLSFALSTMRAQEMASLAGQITDPAGAVVSAAHVSVRNDANAAVFETASDATGFYRIPQLPPGTYTVTITQPGFRTQIREGIVVRVSDRLRLDIALEVGQVTETLTVEGQSPLLQTEDATTGQVIDNQKIVDLPLNNRNWLQLATLAPATVSYVNVFNTEGGNRNNVVMNLGGTHTNQANYLLDGTDNSNFVSAGAVAYPPVDSLQEFKVETNNYTADTGRLGGAVVNASIKSGTNSFHGTAYEFLRNRALNARNFFASPTATKPQFTRNQFGASLGGPIKRDRLFAFLNYEGNRERQNQVVTGQVFTDAQKSGNFSAQLGSQVGTDAAGRPVAQGQIFDPFSIRRLSNGAAVRDPFPGNIIPASRLNPVSKTLIDLVPPPNTAGSPNFVRELSNPLNIDTFAGRVDWVQSVKDSVFGHFIYSDQHSLSAGLLGGVIDGGGFTLGSNQRHFGLGWTHVFSPSTLNDLRLGYLRNHRDTRQLQPNERLNEQFGIPFPFPGPGLGGMASIGIAGFVSLGTAGGTFPQFVNKYEIADNFTVIRGAHNLKFGFQGQLKLFENRNACNSCRGLMNFNGVFTRQPGFTNTGSAVADFLMGTVNDSTLGSVRSEKDVGRDTDFYVQDKWQANRKLTVTVGLRYQYHAPHWEARDLMSNVIYGPGFSNAFLAVPQGMPEPTFTFLRDVLMPYIPVRKTPELGRGLVRPNYRNFAPRLGLAYQLDSRTVIRGGYGIFYGFPDATSSAVLSISPPGNLSITEASNTLDPTLLINRSIFGADPFRRALTNPSFFAIFDPNIKPEFTQMYNLTVQRQFRNSWLLELGFVGNHSSRLMFYNSVNDAAPALPGDSSSPQSRRRVSTVLGNLNYYAPQGWSTYTAMVLSAEKRFSQGLSLLANFTWSRALGFAPPTVLGINTSAVQNPLDFKREYGPLEFDVQKRAVFSYNYELPIGRGKPLLGGASPIANTLIGGWQINGITSLQGGFPLTPSLSISLGRTFTNSRPNIIGDPTATSHRPDDWFNRAAFAIPSDAEIAAGNFFGNAGRGSLRGPGLVNFDFSVVKNTTIRENLRLQYRCEFYNLTNTPFFGGASAVSTNFSSPTFGKVVAAADPRVIQMGLKLVF